MDFNLKEKKEKEELKNLPTEENVIKEMQKVHTICIRFKMNSPQDLKMDEILEIYKRADANLADERRLSLIAECMKKLEEGIALIVEGTKNVDAST